jgi:hypothetical protein
MKKILLAVALAMAVPILAQFTPQPLTTKNTGIVPLKGYFAFPAFATELLPTPARAGIIVWDSTAGLFKKWDGTAWSPLAGQPDLSGFLRLDGTTAMTAPLTLAPVNLEGFFIPPPGAPGGIAYASHDEWGGKPPTLIRTYYPVMGLGRSVDGVYEGEWERLATTNYIEELYSQLEPYIWPGAPGQYWDGTKTWVNLPTGAAWGSITGALSDQTDLSAALAAKRSNSSRGPLFYECEYLSATIAMLSPYTAAEFSGTLATQTGDANHPGILRLSSTAIAGAGAYSNIGGATTANFVIAGGEHYEVVFRLPALYSISSIEMGLGNQTGIGYSTQSLEIRVYNNILSGQAYNGGSAQGTGSTYTVSANTWYRATIDVNQAKTLATYTLYSSTGAQLWQGTTSYFFPTIALTPQVVAQNQGSGAASLIDLDYQSFAVNRTLSR